MTYGKKMGFLINCAQNGISRRTAFKIFALLSTPGIFNRLNAEETTISSIMQQEFLSQKNLCVNIIPIDAEPFTGIFLGFEGEELKFRKPDSAPSLSEMPENKISIRKLRSIDFQVKDPAIENTPNDSHSENLVESPKKKEPSHPRIMIGESVFRAQSIFQKEGKYVIELSSGGTMEPLLPGKIQEILFQDEKLGQNHDLDADWNEIQKMEMSNDLLVILRNEKLSYYYGTILEITPKSVRFEQDGESLNVKLKHIFALRFASQEKSADQNSPKPLLGILTDTAGSQIYAAQIEPDSDRESLSVLTTGGERVNIMPSSLKNLDFTEGRMIFLSSLKPESIDWTPFFQTGLATQNTSCSNLTREFYAPKFNRGFTNSQIHLGGKKFSNGLELCSRTIIQFRLPAQFKKFQTTLGIDDSVRPGGNAEVKILADEKVLFDEIVSGKDIPKVLSLDIANARRLTIRVDFGKDGSLSAYVAFADAQLLK